MELFLNMLIDWVNDSTETQTERLIWINSSRTTVVTINIFVATAWPVVHEYHEIIAAIETNQARLLTVDPYAVWNMPEEDIPAVWRETRDGAWDSIAHLVDNPEIFVRRSRGPLVTAAAEQAGCSTRVIRIRLRRYWQRGICLNALMPDYDKCGGRGKMRPAEHSTNTRKRGRPSLLSEALGETLGVNVTIAIKDFLVLGARVYYERGGLSMSQAHQRTIERYFHVGYRYEGAVRIPEPPPAKTRPSFSQFRYYYEQSFDPEQALRSHSPGRNTFENKHRPLLGDSRHTAFGPGSLYQIDSTRTKIGLVSSITRKRIGRGLLSFVVDVFSGLITGLHVSVERGESWLVAMLTFESSTRDKGLFLKQYGIPFGEVEFPAHHLPEGIVSDRAPTWKHKTANLTALGVAVHLTPPFRPDLKGLVEQSFRLARGRMIAGLPGEITRIRERGTRHPGLDDCLTAYEFTQLMICWAAEYNSTHYIARYPMDRDMIADGVRPCPIDLWHWGIENRSGHLRTIPSPEILHVNLLPQVDAAVKRTGIHFGELDYICPQVLDAKALVVPPGRRRPKITIAHDPRIVDVIYARLPGEQEPIRCDLLPRWNAFRGCTRDEVREHFRALRVEEQASQTNRQRVMARTNAYKDHIFADAQAKTAEVKGQMSKVEWLSGAREERSAEIDRTRKEQVRSDLGLDEKSPKVAVTQNDENIPDQPGGVEYVPEPENIEWFQKLGEEKKDEQEIHS